MAADPISAVAEGVGSLANLGSSLSDKGKARIQSQSEKVKALLDYKARQEEAAAKQSKMRTWVFIGGVSVLAILAIGVAAKVASSK